mmetsp:Transcript_84264/g.243554  ORF Transcript_84264/g.243554 Transcript_84264/m.243554 type:complete len:418 (+) Transcript_84264:86-1339(+)
MGVTCSCNSEIAEFENKYYIAEQLGKGSQGTVHACFERRTGARLAVKILDPNKDSAWTTFRREIDMCNEVSSCPYVVDIVDHYMGYSAYYLIMPRYTAHLKAALKASAIAYSGGIGLENAPLRRLVSQAMAALAYLHGLDIAHRDIKAQNFLTDRLDLRDGACKVVLSDFGLARKLAKGDHFTAAVGTRKYWAPDVYRKKYAHNVDVFAIGVLMFLAASGTYPFESEEQTHKRDVFDEDVVPSILTPEASGFMRSCLEKDPDGRPSAQEMLNRTWLSSHVGEGLWRPDTPTKGLDGSPASTTASDMRSFDEVDGRFAAAGGISPIVGGVDNGDGDDDTSFSGATSSSSGGEDSREDRSESADEVVNASLPQVGMWRAGSTPVLPNERPPANMSCVEEEKLSCSDVAAGRGCVLLRFF